VGGAVITLHVWRTDGAPMQTYDYLMLLGYGVILLQAVVVLLCFYMKLTSMLRTGSE